MKTRKDAKLYEAIQALKERIEANAEWFEVECPGTVLKIAFEVKTKLGTEKIKVAIAGPYHQQAELPFEQTPDAKRIRQWWTEEHGDDRDAN